MRTIEQLQVSIQENKTIIEELQRNELGRRQIENLQSENGELRFQLDNLRRFIDELKRQQQEN